ncbi:MAG: lytic transglycosylase domain-containing protein [Chloroflexota bacterium]|nr:MAG: lytic transglycosylase domain-containing protein [Chloroflexota bacterium]
MKKLSVQIQDGGRDDAWDLVERVSPRILKLLNTAFRWDRAGRWQAGRAPGDSVLVLRYVANDRLEDAIANTRWLIERANEARGHGLTGIVLEIPINEAFQTGDDLSRLAEATVGAVDAVTGAEFGVAIGNFSVGNPIRLIGASVGGEIVGSAAADWPRFLPALRATRAAIARHGVAGFLSLHEYSHPADWRNPWRLTRYRRVWEELPADARLPILVTEFGIDKGTLDGKLDGWRNPMFGLSAGGYADLCRWYRDEVARDPYVHGVTLFVAGAYRGAPPNGWESFEVVGAGEVEDLIREEVDGPPLWLPSATDDRQPPRDDRGSNGGATEPTDYVAIVRAAAERHGVPPDLLDRMARQESSYDEDVIRGRRDSAAGARGLMQIIPRFHPDVDPLDPVAAAEYCAAWLTREASAYGNDWTRAVIAWNGGHGAVEAWEAGEPHPETVAYLTAVVGEAPPGDLCIAQFGPFLADRGFDTATIASACGPIAAVGLAASLGVAVAPEDALREAPRHGWDAVNGMGGAGGNGPANFVAMCAALGVVATPIEREAVLDTLRAGQKIVISTPAHYYLAQRASRIDVDLYVGNTGRARRGGAPWMSLDAIAALDGAINGLFVGRPAVGEAPGVTDESPVALLDAIDREVEPFLERDVGRDAATRIRELTRRLRAAIETEDR